MDRCSNSEGIDDDAPEMLPWSLTTVFSTAYKLAKDSVKMIRGCDCG